MSDAQSRKGDPRSITMLKSFVHKSEHQEFCGVVRGYLGVEGMTDFFLKKRKEKRTTPMLR